MSELGSMTCGQCGVAVQLPANFCDMCGSTLTPGSAAPREVLAQPSPTGVAFDASGEPRADLPSLVASQAPAETETPMSAAQEALRRAYFLLKAIEKELEGFRSSMLEIEQSMDYSLEQEVIGQALLEELMSDATVPRQSQTFQRNLDLALSEIETVHREAEEAVLEIEGRTVSVQTLAGMLDRAWGDLSLSAGRINDAIARYQKSLADSESTDAFFALGIAFECAEQPGRALRAFERSGTLAPRTDVGIEALKSAGRLRSKRIMGGWFMGSWKVLFIPVGLTAVGLFAALFDARLLLVPVVCAIFAGSYWRSKFRR